MITAITCQIKRYARCFATPLTPRSISWKTVVEIEGQTWYCYVNMKGDDGLHHNKALNTGDGGIVKGLSVYFEVGLYPGFDRKN